MNDPILVEVISNWFLSISEEMAAVMIRAAYSSNIKERTDCSTAIFDAGGQLIAQAARMPLHLSSMLGLVEHVRRRHGTSQIRPGDAFIANDPYNGGGSHLPDLTIATPVFYERELVAFVASIGHHADVGGSVRGSENIAATSIFEDGLRLPPVRLRRRGALQQDVLDIILLNSRTPAERLGDLRAQLACNDLGERRVRELYRKHGRQTVDEAMAAILDYAENRIRKALADFPDGSYEFEEGIDYDPSFRIKVRIDIAGSDIHLDFTGSSPQVESGKNVPFNALQAAIYYTLKAMADPEVPANAGYFRAIRITAPEGTVVNPLPPASVSVRQGPCILIANAIVQALASAVPHRAMAGCDGRIRLVLSGEDQETHDLFVDYQTQGSGGGGRSTIDGWDGAKCLTTNSSNVAVEVLEQQYPIRVERYEFIPDSGGAGQFRGGLGIRRVYRVLDVPLKYGLDAERRELPCQGRFGGRDGALGRIIIDEGTEREVVVEHLAIEAPILPGQTLTSCTSGGGGWGNPADRDPALIERDLRLGKITPEHARREYGFQGRGA